jgi:hypothetical protein
MDQNDNTGWLNSLTPIDFETLKIKSNDLYKSLLTK